MSPLEASNNVNPVKIKRQTYHYHNPIFAVYASRLITHHHQHTLHVSIRRGATPYRLQATFYSTLLL